MASDRKPEANRLADKARPAPGTAQDPGTVPLTFNAEIDERPEHRAPNEPPNLVSDARRGSRSSSPIALLIGLAIVVLGGGALVWALA